MRNPNEEYLCPVHKVKMELKEIELTEGMHPFSQDERANTIKMSRIEEKYNTTLECPCGCKFHTKL